MLAVLLAVWSFAIWPFVVRSYVSVGSGFSVTGYFIIRTIGGSVRFDWHMILSQNGPDILIRYGKPKRMHEHRMKNMRARGAEAAKALHLSSSFKKHIRQYLKDLQIKAEIRLGTGDAAVTAVICAFLSGLIGCIPQALGSVTPDFHSKVFCADISCIAPLRLGKLFVSAAVAAFALLRCRLRKIGGGAKYGSSASD